MRNRQEIFRRAFAKEQLIQLQGCPNCTTYTTNQLIFIFTLKGLQPLQLFYKILLDGFPFFLGRQNTLNIFVITIQRTLGDADCTFNLAILVGNQFRTAATNIHQQSLLNIAFNSCPQEIQLCFLSARNYLHLQASTAINLLHRLLAVLNITQSSSSKDTHFMNIEIVQYILKFLQYADNLFNTRRRHILSPYIRSQTHGFLFAKKQLQLPILNIIYIHSNGIGTNIYDSMHQ